MNTCIFTFAINNNFSECPRNSDDSLELQKQPDINTLYRGVSTIDKSKCGHHANFCWCVLRLRKEY